MTNLKVSKNVTFEMDNLMVIEQLMTRTRRNFSQTVNILIRNWVTMNRMYEEQKKTDDQRVEEIQKTKEQAERYREQILKAKPLKEK